VELPYVSETSRATGSRWGGVQVYRAAEAATVTASKPQLETMEIRLADLMGIMYATERLMRDASAFGSIATKAFSSEFAFKLDDEIVRGSGVGQCKGLLNSLTTATPAGAVISVTKDTNQVAATFTNTNISNMWVRLMPRSKANAVWFINHELGPQLDVLSIPAGTAALEPRFVSYGPDGILRIKGRPVVEVEQCAALGTVGDVILADMSDYLLIAKGGLNQAESMHVRFLYNERAFRWTRSVNGAPATRSALTPYKGTATLSPYVVLATRA
jgi:HK97 family phage major capsid protein